MKKKNKIIIALVGLFIMIVLLISEILSPEKSEFWHTMHTYLNVGGIVMFLSFFILAIKRTKKPQGKNKS